MSIIENGIKFNSLSKYVFKPQDSSEIGIKSQDMSETVVKAPRNSESKCKSYKCDLCGLNVACFSNLQSHIITHIKLKPWTCSICSKVYMFEYGLRQHIAKHGQPLILKQCSICDKVFKTKSELKNHLVIHTGEYP